MPSPEPQSLSPQFQKALAECAEGIIGPNLLLMQLFLWANSPNEARAVLNDALSDAQWSAAGRSNLAAAFALWDDTPAAFQTVKAVQAAGQAGNGWASAFDEAAAISPEASVALYSLGRADILAEATDEVVRVLRDWGLLGRDRHVLEIGCGIGRFLRPLAAEVASITGLDISPRMVAEARRRCADLDEVAVIEGYGTGLPMLADQQFDLVLGIDSFPYIVTAKSDLPACYMADVARVLNPGGSFVIFNYSYRGDDAHDLAELESLARANNLAMIRAGERPFRLWDGIAYWLQRPACEERSATGER
ncbi:class I SAM-dependent DNA methyltransferase [Rhodoligotrophos ferricapiens]|uniref:class I SAM-dependent DNA methyltransferase n=1 Tax=Rhodoligotrophos ferricapiens TaxID=3069264 RepID=UPI00315C7742